MTSHFSSLTSDLTIDGPETLTPAQIVAKADALLAELHGEAPALCVSMPWASAYPDAEALALTALPTCLPGAWILAQALIANEPTQAGASAGEAIWADRPALARGRSRSVPVARTSAPGRGRRPAIWSARQIQLG